MNERSLREVRALLRTWGVVRIAYGVVALFAPRVIVKLLRVQPHPDVRGFNAFLGSRDIVIGAYSIAAASNGREMDAVALNQGCEANRQSSSRTSLLICSRLCSRCRSVAANAASPSRLRKALAIARCSRTTDFAYPRGACGSSNRT